MNLNDELAQYGYDATSQLTDATYEKLPTESYQYDLNGNRKNFVTGKNNQLTNDGVFKYTYDSEGNRVIKISKKSRTDYFWDHRNCLVKVIIDGKMVKYVYDYQNRLVKRNDEFFVHDGWQIVLTLDSERKVNEHFLWGARQDELLCENDHWTLCDHLGTVREIVGKNSNNISHLEYSAFGELLNVSGIKPRFRYTGKMFDNVTQLQWNINRWYDAKAGKWISEDPIGFMGYDVNLLRYCNNSTITNVDTVGFVSCPSNTWNFWGASSSAQVIIGYSYANVNFYCQKGMVTKKKIYKCCSNQYEQKYLKLAMAEGSIHTAILGAGVGISGYRALWGIANNAPEHTDLAGWGWISLGISGDVVIIGGEYSGGPGGGNVGGGIGLGLGFSLSAQWAYTTVSTGYYVFMIKPLDITTKKIIESEKCKESFENVDPPIEEDISGYV
jgi:RHS repeat-associated protein